MIRDRNWFSRLFDSLNYVFLTLFALLCLLPLFHIFAVSLSGRAPATGGFVSFWPIDFTLENYEQVMGSRNFLRSFYISVARVLTGTSLNMILVILTAYPLSKTPRAFRGRTVFIWFFVFAMLFDGGLIPLFFVGAQPGPAEYTGRADLAQRRADFQRNLDDEFLSRCTKRAGRIGLDRRRLALACFVAHIYTSVPARHRHLDAVLGGQPLGMPGLTH